MGLYVWISLSRLHSCVDSVRLVICRGGHMYLVFGLGSLCMYGVLFVCGLLYGIVLGAVGGDPTKCYMG